jgi:lipopolysaccharide export system permease protein
VNKRNTAHSPLAIPGQRYSKTVFFYIAREILFAFMVCFLFFFFIFFVNQILLMARDIMEKRVPIHQVALLVLYSMPAIIAMACPFACLTGTLMTIGRFNSDNEILVMLSAGFSHGAVFLPALVVGILISCFSFFANDILLPAGTVQFSRLYRSILLSSPALELEANSVKRFKNSVVITGPVTGKAIQKILIMDRTAEGERRLITAREANLEDSGDGNFSINLEGAFVRSGKENLKKDYDYASAARLRYFVPQEDIVQSVFSVGPREMSSVDVLREIKLKEEVLRKNTGAEYKEIAAGAMGIEEALRNGQISRANDLVSDWRYAVQTVRAMLKDRSLAIYRLEFFKKFAVPFGALSFVLIAVSIGLMANKSGQTVGFIIGISIAAFYWTLLLIGQTMGTQMGFSPFWSMWLPNILSITAGLSLTLARLFVR